MTSENRIDQRFAALKEAGKPAFIAYVCAGDPDMDRSLEILFALERAGADILELGVPFSDPMADGVVDLIRKFRERSETPIVLFTYLTPIYSYGFAQFHEDAAAAGADGVLLLDLPPDEASLNSELTESGSLRHIRLIAPTTPADRIPKLAASAEGFIYYVSREGVTGTQTALAEGIAENVAAIKAHTKVPVAVGFGISTPAQAAEVGRASDGVVVGSAIVRIIEQNGASPDVAAKVEAFVKPLVDAAKSI